MARIIGVNEVRRILRQLPPALKAEVMKEVRASTKKMHQDAMQGFATASKFAPFYHGKLGMQNITGAARRSYRYSVSETQLKGRVGQLSSGASRSAFYLRFFLYGTVNQPARPVHDVAFEKNRQPYIDNQTKALRRVLGIILP